MHPDLPRDDKVLDNPYTYTDYRTRGHPRGAGVDLRRVGVELRRGMAGRGSGPDFVEALARGLDVLACFDADRPTMTLSEVAVGRRAGPADRPPAAAHPGRARLRPGQRQHVRADPQGARPRDRVRSSLGLWDLARPHLEALVARTGESSSMAQLDGSDIVYVARVVGAQDHRAAGRHRHPVPGGPDLAGQGAARRACRGRGRRRRWPQPSRSGLPADTGRPSPSLRRELIRVRAQGWALADEELAPGVRSVAAPVRDGTGDRPGRDERHRARGGDLHRDAAPDYLPLLLRDRRRVSGDWALWQSRPHVQPA